MGKVAKLAGYRAKNSTHNVEGWREAFREHLEAEERSDNTITSYLSDLDAFVKWFEKTQGSALAGHESLGTTRRYCEPSPHDLALAVELIGEED